MTATAATDTKGPAAQGFAELAELDAAERNINARLHVLNDELAPIGWRGRPAVPAIPGVANGDRGVARPARVADLLREIPREQTAAAREGRDPDIAKIEADLAPLEQRSAELRAEIRVLVRERQGLPDQRRAVVRRHYPQFVAHVRDIAREKAEHADQFAEMARQVLANRAELVEAIRLSQTGRPIAGMTEHQSAEIANRMFSSFAPWTTSNRPALTQLWRAIETVAGASFAAAEREAA